VRAVWCIEARYPCTQVRTDERGGHQRGRADAVGRAYRTGCLRQAQRTQPSCRASMQNRSNADLLLWHRAFEARQRTIGCAMRGGATACHPPRPTRRIAKPNEKSSILPFFCYRRAPAAAPGCSTSSLLLLLLHLLPFPLPCPSPPLVREGGSRAPPPSSSAARARKHQLACCTENFCRQIPRSAAGKI
jgi:hypothetical protein